MQTRLIAVVSVLILACTRSPPPPTRHSARPTARPAAGTKSLQPPQEPLRVSDDVVAPVVVKRVDPDWSKVPKKFRYTGIVLIEAVIDENGIPMQVRALKGQPELADPTVAAIKQWRFKPGTLRGKPVPVVYNLTVSPHFR